MRILIIPARVLLIAVTLTVFACGPSTRNGDDRTIVFKHEKFFGDSRPLEKLLKRFEQENPGWRVKDEILPASSDDTHQFYVINLEARSSDFDVLAMDVIWIPEFARAGWLRDISHLLSLEERNSFFDGPVEAVTIQDRLYAIPWYIDAGLLYYRKDLLEEYGFLPPETWPELLHIALEIRKERPDLYGFLWQGKQYEGLICNALEFLWSNGGSVLSGSRVVLNSPANREALTFLRDLIYVHKVSPEFVTTAVEDTTRRTFGSGKAIFMRNWPYAWSLFQKEDSVVKGKVGISTLPAFPGHSSASTLGGWQLGINRYSKKPEASEKLVQFLTSRDVQKSLAMEFGYNPTRKDLYSDQDLLQQQPHIQSLYAVFESARPRPVTPFYMMISQVLQPEISAILARIREPEDALAIAMQQIEFLLSANQ